MKEFEGKNIKEVWDFRLSSAVPVIVRDGGTWVVKIYSKNNPDYVDGQPPAEPLEVYDTGIKSEAGDAQDCEKVKKCFEFLYSVRDKYALPKIEEMKPKVAAINRANAALADLGAYK